MAGNKNSGRRGYQQEILAKSAIELSFHTVIKALKDENLPIDLRLRVAGPIAAKYIPQKLETENLNELSADQKFALINRYLAGLENLRPFQIENNAS